MDAERMKQFQALIEAEPDDTLLRFGLARLLFDQGQPAQAALHLEHAVQVDPGYSAAWREPGRARREAGDPEGARRAWETGIPAAEAKGDLQTAKEMRVFLARLSAD